MAANDSADANSQERFQGETGRLHLREAFKAQKIVAGDQALAERIAEIGTLIEVSSGTAIIEQGAEENDVFLIIAGAFDVLVNGRRVSRRFSNDHIGEMAAIQPTQRRSATCISSEKSVVCRLSEPQLTELGREFPNIWRYIAKELARRLEQRNAHVTATHDKINVFIISSVEALEIARTIQNALAHDLDRRRFPGILVPNREPREAVGSIRLRDSSRATGRHDINPWH